MLVLVGILIHIMQSRGLVFRKQKVEIENEYTRQFIRNIMSKFEILQSGKIEKEIESLNTKLDEIKQMEMKKHVYEHTTYNIGNVAVNITRGLLLLFV